MPRCSTSTYGMRYRATIRWNIFFNGIRHQQVRGTGSTRRALPFTECVARMTPAFHIDPLRTSWLLNQTANCAMFREYCAEYTEPVATMALMVIQNQPGHTADMEQIGMGMLLRAHQNKGTRGAMCDKVGALVAKTNAAGAVAFNGGGVSASPVRWVKMCFVVTTLELPFVAHLISPARLGPRPWRPCRPWRPWPQAGARLQALRASSTEAAPKPHCSTALPTPSIWRSQRL